MSGTMNVQPQKDRRFDSDEWSKLPVFDFIKQSYLLIAGVLIKSTDAIPVEGKEKEKLKNSKPDLKRKRKNCKIISIKIILRLELN